MMLRDRRFGIGPVDVRTSNAEYLGLVTPQRIDTACTNRKAMPLIDIGHEKQSIISFS